MYISFLKFLTILYSFSSIEFTFANVIRGINYFNSENSSAPITPQNNKDIFKITYIYNTDSNLCLTYKKKESYRLALKACTENNQLQQWYVPTEGANYWILAPTLSFYNNTDTMNQFEVDSNTIQNYFNENSICISIKPNGTIITSKCVQEGKINATIMDPVDITHDQNLIKASSVNNNLCLGIFPEDISFYEVHKKNIGTSLLYHINPNTLKTHAIRCNMNQCSNDNTQTYAVFNNYIDLVDYQNRIYNPYNYQDITDIKVNLKNIFLRVGEVKKINMEIFAGETKVSRYPNVSYEIENTHIAQINESVQTSFGMRSIRRRFRNVMITGTSIGSTFLTITVHDKTVKLNIIVDDNTDKITFLDIQNSENNVGDCIIIQSLDDNGQPIYGMIDVGKDSDVSTLRMLAYLKDNNIRKLEWVLITHFHDDHVGGLAKLIESDTEIGSIYMKKYANLDTKYNPLKGKSVEVIREFRLNEWNKMIDLIENNNIPINYVGPNVNNHLDVGNYHFELFNLEEVFEGFDAACSKFRNCNENTNSVIAVVENNGRYYYLNGDIDTYPYSFYKSNNINLKNAYESHTVDKWIIKFLTLFNIDHFDVMKAGHHGVLYNNIEEAYIAAKPDYCVVTTEKVSIADRIGTLEERIRAGNPNVNIYYSGNGIITVSQDINGNIRFIQGIDEHDA